MSLDEVHNCDTRVLFTIPYSGPPIYVAWFMHCNNKKSHHLCMVCYLGDQAWWLSRNKRCFFTRSGRGVSIRLSSVTYCTSQLTSQRACQYCCCIHRHSKKGQSISFLPSDMMHVHFATRKVARPKMPISKGRYIYKYLVVLSKPSESHHFQPIPSP